MLRFRFSYSVCYYKLYQVPKTLEESKKHFFVTRLQNFTIKNNNLLEI